MMIHETAVVDDGAMIGSGTKVWHFCHVMKGAVIGSDCVLGQNVFVAGSARIGSGVKIQNNVSVYDGVSIEDDVFLGPSCVFTNVKTPRASVDRRGEFAKTHLERGVTVGANATVICGISIGCHAMIGAGAVVTGDVAPHALMTGVPAKQAGWVCECGCVLEVDDQPRLCCRECSSEYLLSDGRLRAK